MKVRLPWPFGRSTADPADTDTDQSAGSLAGPIPFAPEPPRSTGAWAALPPIQRAVGSPPLVAPADAFFDAVPGVHPLPPILETLGHDVTTVAPTGLVGAPVHAVASLTSSAPLVPPPVQRRADASTGDPTGIVDEASFSAPSLARDAAATAAASDPPIRQLGVVTPSAAVRPPDRSLTRAEPAAAPPDRSHQPLVSRRTQVQAPSAAAPAAAPVAGPLPSEAGPTAPAAPSTAGPRRVGLGAPLAATPSTAVPSLHSPAGLAVSRLAGGPSVAAATTPGPGVSGAALPLAAGRGSATSPTAGAAPLRTTIQRRTIGASPASADDAPADTEAGGPISPSPAPLPASQPPALPALRVVGRPGAVAEPGAGGSTASPPSTTGVSAWSGSAAHPTPSTSRPTTAPGAGIADAGSGVAPLGSSMPPPRRPLVGRQPIGPSAPVQRSAAEHERAAAPAGGPATPAGAAGPAGGPATQGEAAAPAWSWSLESPGGGWTPGGFGTLPQPTSPAGIPTGPSIQRRPSAPSDAPALTMATGLPRSLDRIPTASTSLARSSAPIALPLAAPTVARSVATEVQGPTFQASPAGPAPTPAAPVLAPTATPVIQRVDTSAPPPPSKSGGERSDDELDELARALFGRFRNRLRSEYIYEREAKGLTFDQA